MRRPALLLSFLLLVGALLIRLRRRHATGSLGGGVPVQPLTAPAAALPAAPADMRFVSVPWTLTGTSDDQPALTIRYRSDKHMELDRIDLQETPTQLFVTVLMRWQPPDGGWFAFADEHEATIPLSQPLGERELVHAPVDEPSDRPLYP